MGASRITSPQRRGNINPPRGYGSEQTLYTRTGGVGIAGKYRALEQKIPPKSKEGFDPQGLKAQIRQHKYGQTMGGNQEGGAEENRLTWARRGTREEP